MSVRARIRRLERLVGAAAGDGFCTCADGRALVILYDGDPDIDPVCPRCGGSRMAVRFVLRREDGNGEHAGSDSALGA